MSDAKHVDQFLTGDGLDTSRKQDIGQHIGYRYDVNLVPGPRSITQFLKKYIELMGWGRSELAGRRSHGFMKKIARPCSTAISTAGYRCRRTSSCPTTSRTAT